MSASHASSEHLPVPSSSDDSLRLSALDRDSSDVHDACNFLRERIDAGKRSLHERLTAWEAEAIASLRQ